MLNAQDEDGLSRSQSCSRLAVTLCLLVMACKKKTTTMGSLEESCGILFPVTMGQVMCQIPMAVREIL